MNRELRPHQHQAIAMLRQSIASGKRRPVLQAATGFGKTLLGAAIIEGALRKSNRVLFTVPVISLVDQTVNAFFAEGLTDIGVMQGRHEMTDWSKPVQIASIQTLMRRPLPKADVVIHDECHRMFDFVGEWMAKPEWRSVPMIGLSATPWTKGLGKHYDDLLISATTKDLIRDGYLAPFRVFAPSHPDLSRVRTVAGDYHEGDLGDTMDTPPLVADVVENWLLHGQDRPTFCFAVNRAHAKHLAEQFMRAGVPSGYVDAYTDREEREVIADQFKRGQIKIVCNVGCLTTGVDWDVRAIILARPTKSEMLFVQMIGRGLRTAPGKADCILRGTMILTDRGEVKIEDITLDHKMWDGVNFVSHKGAVCKGVRSVISHDGVTATPDHRVMTDEGWKTISEASSRSMRIARTGFGGHSLRFFGNHISEGRGLRLESSRRGALRKLLWAAHGSISQHEKKAQLHRLSSLPSLAAGQSAEMAISAMPRANESMLQSAVAVIRKLWRSGHRIPFQKCERSGSLDRVEFRNCRSVHGNRSYRQQWALRTGQSEVGAPDCEHEQYAPQSRWPRSLHSVSSKSSAHKICGSDACEIDISKSDGRSNRAEVDDPIIQTKGEVWDILNAGPLQRFTANGRLVHNCLVFDHSDTHARLGFVTDIHHDHLDDGRERQKAQPRREAMPRECTQCHFLRPAKVSRCPACGFKPERQCEVEVEDGELVEFGVGATAKPKASAAEKQAWYSMLLKIADDRGYKPGWVANQYRQKFDVWPRGLSELRTDPSPEVSNYVKSRMIAYAKGRKHHDAHPGA